MPVALKLQYAVPTLALRAPAYGNAVEGYCIDGTDVLTVYETVRQALEYTVKLAKFYPPDAPAWDDASNNKWLVSGKGALIMNPPSAWAVAKRDAPQIAEQIWHHPMPKGPKGRFVAATTQYLSVWSFSKNKAAAVNQFPGADSAARSTILRSSTSNPRINGSAAAEARVS